MTERPVDPLLELAGIVKRFGGTTALAGARLSVAPGTVHAVLGENGAGKTTLMRIAYGLIQPDAGQLALRTQPVRFRSPRDAINAGIGMVHQHFTNVAAMTVAENVALGGRGRFDRARVSERIRRLAVETGLAIDPEARVGDLRIGAQQRLEILKALARDARILVLDEPTAVLAPGEANDLLEWLRQFVAGGRSAVLVTHKLREALSIADDVTVLRRGQTVLTSLASKIDANALAAAMLGETPESLPELLNVSPSASRALTGRAPVASARAIRVRSTQTNPGLHAVSLEVRAGEILGVAAVENAGHHLLLRALAGRIVPSEGDLQLPESIGFVPEDRQRDGLLLNFDLAANVALRGAGRRSGIIRWPAWRSLTAKLIAEYDVRPNDVSVPAAALSGGNQQRLVLARELQSQPSLIVAENPTRGLDIRAAAMVHARLRQAAENGQAVVVYSSDLDEVLSLATRVVAVHAGRVREVGLDRELVGRAILGLA